MVEIVLLQIRARVLLVGLATTAKKVNMELINGLCKRVTSYYRNRECNSCIATERLTNVTVKSKIITHFTFYCHECSVSKKSPFKDM